MSRRGDRPRARRARRPPHRGRDAAPGSGRRRRAGAGRLRIYLGMAPGVGKTYRMLEEGHRRVGARHGRRRRLRRDPRRDRVRRSCSTASRSCPRRRIEYRGVVVEEMDTDAVLARDPTVALVDELAHTNVPGSARAKRWQDVEVIRDAGIHVISTLNVQHLECVADAVATITGAPVNERLPDEVLARRRRDRARRHEPARPAPAHEARQRLPARAGRRSPSTGSSPRRNLTALRELALRLVARTGGGPARGDERPGRDCRSSRNA